LTNFHNGNYGYKLNGKWGLINKNGIEITPPKYETLLPLKNGFGKYELNNKWGFIDSNGNELTKPLFGFYDICNIKNRSNNIFWEKHNIIFKNYSIYDHKIKIIL
jgi:hypothetical protein